jgi:hypothetical protein
MKQLNKVLKTNGFIYSQEHRNNKFAIYSQWIGNEIIAYELIKIRKRSDRELFGKYYQASEVYPDTKSWGQEGWTFKNYSNAVKRFNDYSKDPSNLTVRVNDKCTLLPVLDISSHPQ